MAGLAARLLGALATAAVRRPRVTAAAAAALVTVSLAAAAARLELRTSNLDLIDADLAPVAAFRRFAREFGTPNVLVVVLEGRDGVALGPAVEAVAARIRTIPGVRGVLARLPYDREALARLGQSPYLLSRDGRLAVIFVQPADVESRADRIEPLVRGVRSAVDAAGLDRLAIRAGLTGLPQYALDDRTVIQRELSRLSLLAYLLVLLLFVAAFRAIARPLMAMVALSAAVAVTLGVTALVPGHLTLVSAFVFSMLFGLGIDYGIHVIDRVEELMADGRSRETALVAAVRGLAPGLATGALTTAGALVTFTVSGFKGFRELGLVSAIGIVLSLVAMAALLPALLALLPERGWRRRSPRHGIARALVSLQRPWLAWTLGLAALSGLVAGPPPFDSDYLHLEPRGSEAVRLERAMVDRSDFSPQFAAFVVDSAERARTLAAQLAQEPTVARVRSVADLDLLDRLAGPGLDGRDAFASSLVSPSGRYAVYAYPRGDVWVPAVRDVFLDRLATLDPAVTGMPVLGRFMIERSRRALRVTGLLSALLVPLLVLADFRHPGLAALAVLPTALGVAALLGGMRLLGLAFNPLDVMAIPVVVGVGVDNGVHVVHRLVAERGDLGRTLAGTGRSLLLCSLTTMAGFGPLIFTSHQGLASFALVLTAGVAVTLVLSLLVLPLCCRWALGGRGATTRAWPGDPAESLPGDPR